MGQARRAGAPGRRVGCGLCKASLALRLGRGCGPESAVGPWLSRPGGRNTCSLWRGAGPRSLRRGRAGCPGGSACRPGPAAWPGPLSWAHDHTHLAACPWERAQDEGGRNRSRPARLPWAAAGNAFPGLPQFCLLLTSRALGGCSRAAIMKLLPCSPAPSSEGSLLCHGPYPSATPCGLWGPRPPLGVGSKAPALSLP